MATLTRSGTTLTPTEVIGWSMRRESKSVVHDILGSDVPEVTIRPSTRWRGTLRTFWWTKMDAQAAVGSLMIPGGYWTLNGGELFATGTRVQVLAGDLAVEAADDAGRRWFVDIPIVEVS